MDSRVVGGGVRCDTLRQLLQPLRLQRGCRGAVEEESDAVETGGGWEGSRSISGGTMTKPLPVRIRMGMFEFHAPYY